MTDIDMIMADNVVLPGSMQGGGTRKAIMNFAQGNKTQKGPELAKGEKRGAEYIGWFINRPGDDLVEAAEKAGFTVTYLWHEMSRTAERHIIFPEGVTVIPVAAQVWDFQDCNAKDAEARAEKKDRVRPGVALGWADFEGRQKSYIAVEVIIPELWNAGYEETIRITAKGLIVEEVLQILMLHAYASAVVGARVFQRMIVLGHAGEKEKSTKDWDKSMQIPGMLIDDTTLEKAIELWKTTPRYAAFNDKQRVTAEENFRLIAMPCEEDDLTDQLAVDEEFAAYIKTELLRPAIEWSSAYTPATKKKDDNEEEA